MDEIERDPKCIDTFRNILDETLQNLNLITRPNEANMTLNPLVINVARKNLFYDYKAKR
jgi:hypothetical protein